MTTSGGYQCPDCGYWVVDGTKHFCSKHTRIVIKIVTELQSEIHKLYARFTALEAEVKRLASRKVCQICKGNGYLVETFSTTTRTYVGLPKCADCNGTGYTEDK